MVFFVPKNNPLLTCYLLGNISSDELQAFKSAFELGTHAQFDPMLEIKIVHPPEDCIGQSHEYLRKKEDDAGRWGPFLILDEKAVENDAVWYVSYFATDEPIEISEAESTEVLWKILIKTDKLAMVYVNYSIANISIQENLEACGVKIPAKKGFEQLKVFDYDDMDMKKELYRQPAWVRAEPHEYEFSKGGEKLGNYTASENQYVRLKEGIAEELGLVNYWTNYYPTGPFPMPDGTMKEFPKDTMMMELKYNPDFSWPPYQWPEGSL